MPIIVTCPSCAGQLRVADDLIGRKVRCPACSSTFEAHPIETPPPAPAAPPVDRPVSTEQVDAWNFLNLELGDEPARPSVSASPPLPRPEPKKTVDLDSDDSTPIPTAPLDSTPRPSSRSRARLNDDHD